MPWWEAKVGQKPLVPVRRVRCPVCAAIFGLVPKGTVTSFHCSDCRATYTFTSFDSKPTVHLDEKDKIVCHCTVCEAKRGVQKEPDLINSSQPEGFDE